MEERKEGGAEGRRRERDRGTKRILERMFMPSEGLWECTYYMGAFFLTAPRLFNANTRSQPTGSSACHCRAGKHFELQHLVHPNYMLWYTVYLSCSARQKPVILGTYFYHAIQITIPHMWKCATSNAPSHKFLKLLGMKVKYWRKRQFGTHTV